MDYKLNLTFITSGLSSVSRFEFLTNQKKINYLLIVLKYNLKLKLIII